MPDHPLDAPEVTESNISDLMAKDTRKCSQAELDRLIEEVRVHRHLWEQEESGAKKKGKRPNPNKGLGLKDLKLKL